MTQTMLTGAYKSKDAMRMPTANKTKPFIMATWQFIHNHTSFNYAIFSTFSANIGHFAILGGGEGRGTGLHLNPSNAWRFVGEPRILVLN